MSVPLKHKLHTQILDGVDSEVEGQTVIVKYRNTPVVTFNNYVIILDTGGWKTVTIKQRMNQAAREFGLEFCVYQRRFTWYVRFRALEYLLLDDKITLTRRL